MTNEGQQRATAPAGKDVTSATTAMAPTATHPRPLPAIGTCASITRTITEVEVRAFAEITGDTNELHIDPEQARRTRFGRPIAHGILTAGLISAVIGTKLPGFGAIYLGQTLKFLRPVYLHDTITATAAVIAVRPEKRIFTLRTECVNQRGEVVIEGEATVMDEDPA